MANSLYLDTNIYLSFYHLTNDDIEELSKLLLLVKNKELILYLPDQTKDEFYRNRDSKVADGLKKFNENKLNKIFPQMVKDYSEEYKLMRNAIKAFEKNKQIYHTLNEIVPIKSTILHLTNNFGQIDILLVAKHLDRKITTYISDSKKQIIARVFSTR